ncbi:MULTISPECIES: hypothetical protein [Streptomyces]|uniref:hypothetical protein n=1 Tax=Streptomyces TaxID=1883 RepID=UPI00166F7D49|nr:hypothetical protein [Streptomyces ruber]
MGETHGRHDFRDGPAVPPPSPPPSSPQSHTNTVQGTPRIQGSTVQVRDVTNLHVHPPPGPPPPPSAPPAEPASPRAEPPPDDVPRHGPQPSGVIIRVEIAHQRYIEIYDEGLARYIINAHLKGLGLGHE